MNSLLSDPWIASEVDRAVAPYAGRLDAADLAWMREQLAEILASDPEVAAALKGAHPRVVEVSGEVAAVGGSGDEAQPAQGRRDASGGGSRS